MEHTALNRSRGILALLLVLGAISILLGAAPTAGAVHRGCEAKGVIGYAEVCTFKSLGGRILAAAEATSYVVRVIRPNNTFLTCLQGAFTPAVNICDTTPGSTVYVFARLGVATARLLEF